MLLYFPKSTKTPNDNQGNEKKRVYNVFINWVSFCVIQSLSLSLSIFNYIRDMRWSTEDSFYLFSVILDENVMVSKSIYSLFSVILI